MIAKEIEKEGIRVVFITAMVMIGKQIGANRVVIGTKIPHPCGDPYLPEEGDRAVRRGIIKCAFGAIQTDVSSPTIFVPDVSFTSG